MACSRLSLGWPIFTRPELAPGAGLLAGCLIPTCSSYSLDRIGTHSLLNTKLSHPKQAGRDQPTTAPEAEQSTGKVLS